jgi:GTP-binding protein Era
MSNTPESPWSPGATNHRAGTVALVGRPNAGKSTLLNQILGTHLAIVSDKPQTTRNRVVGVHTAPDYQIVFVDTPGIHDARGRMNRAMVEVARGAMGEVDTVCWVIDGERAVEQAKANAPILHRGLDTVKEMLAQVGPPPTVIAINKADRCPKPWLLPVIAELSTILPNVEVVPISARTGDGVPELLNLLSSRLPIKPALHTAETVTTNPERFVIGELIREKVFHLTWQEVPYGTAVEVERMEEEEAEGGGTRTAIYARIFVEREGQKGVIIGKGGVMLREIGTRARKDIAAMLGTRVYLELHVSVVDRWTENARILREQGIE